MLAENGPIKGMLEEGIQRQGVQVSDPNFSKLHDFEQVTISLHLSLFTCDVHMIISSDLNSES
jgi:hypothetical protein